MGCLLDDRRVFGIETDQWRIAAQDAEEWNKIVDTRGGILHDEMDRGRESQDCNAACSSMPERDGKDQREGSPKQARSCWFARHC